MRLPALSTVAGIGLALLALASPAGALAAGAPVQADSAVSTGGVGFRVDGDPGSQLVDGFIPLTGTPGQTLSGHFFVTNTQAIGATMAVYPADGLTGATTGVVYSDADDGVSEAGTWVSPDRTSVSVGPRSEQQINFSVTIPAGAAAGDHVAGVVLEQKRPGSAATGAISQVVRNVVPIMIVVPGAAGPQINVKSAAITTLPGSQLLAITVNLRNDGLKLCKPQLSVTLGGNTGGTQNRQLDTILPGDRAPFPMPWPTKLTASSYLVHVVAAGCGATDTLDVTLQTPKSQEENTANTATNSSSQNVVTNADPSAATYTPGGGKSTKGDGSSKKHKKKATIAGVSGSAMIAGLSAAGGGGKGGGGGASAGGAHGASAGSGGAKKGLFPKLADAVSAVAKHVPDIAERATIPLSFLLLVGLLFFAQEAIDRRDPKLALAPLHREQDLAFDPDPLGGGRLIPSPTDLSPGTS